MEAEQVAWRFGEFWRRCWDRLPVRPGRPGAAIVADIDWYADQLWVLAP
jgi:hypothetical protein